MTQEEKAKAYDEAIKVAADIKAGTATYITDGTPIIDAIFPELKESKDEKIKKVIYGWIYTQPSSFFDDGFSKEEMLAWLEKQGEQKSAWTPMDDQRVENLLAIIEGHGYPGEVAWLNSLKDRVQSKQGEQKKPTWSEEDEQLYNDLSDTYFYNDEDYPEETYKRMLKKVLDWMNKRAKSLRPQSTWKPSDYQIEALESATENCAYSEYQDYLRELIEHLKKLKEE